MTRTRWKLSAGVYSSGAERAVLAGSWDATAGEMSLYMRTRMEQTWRHAAWWGGDVVVVLGLCTISNLLLPVPRGGGYTPTTPSSHTFGTSGTPPSREVSNTGMKVSAV